jgi:hypothetical protein
MKRKVFRILFIESKRMKHKKYSTELAMMYRKTKLLKIYLNKLRYFIKIIIPEEKTMNAAYN